MNRRYFRRGMPAHASNVGVGFCAPYGGLLLLLAGPILNAIVTPGIACEPPQKRNAGEIELRLRRLGVQVQLDERATVAAIIDNGSLQDMDLSELGLLTGLNSVWLGPQSRLSSKGIEQFGLLTSLKSLRFTGLPISRGDLVEASERLRI